MKLKKAQEFYSENKIEKKIQNIPFMEYFKTVFSQFGEDGILEEIIKRIDCQNKFYVEFGAGNGTIISNTANLRINKNWKGLLLEGDKSMVDSVNSKEINLYHEMIFSNNINELFVKYNVPEKFGLLSVDIDGDDAYVLEALDTNRFTPDIIIAEFNPGLPNNYGIKIKEQRGNLSNSELHKRGYLGCNLKEINNILTIKDYKFVTTVSVNCIFVKSDLFSKLKIDDLCVDDIMRIHSYPGGYETWRIDIINCNDEWVITH
jgi:hypothetical protein